MSLLGRELTGLSTAALEGVGGFVEEPAFYGYLSGRANLALLARLDGRRSAAAQIDDALARVDLYKAQSPPSSIGGPTMRDAGGHSVANPLFVVYGCFNTF